MFGSIVSENARKDDVSLDDVAVTSLEELDVTVGGLDRIDEIVTGMTHRRDRPVTNALENAVEALDADIEVTPFYANVSAIAEDDGIDYGEAWQRGIEWRNEKTFTPAEDEDDETKADLAVRVGDGGGNGAAMLKHARRKGVTGIDINVDQLVDRDVAYGDDEDDEAEAEGADEGADSDDSEE